MGSESTEFHNALKCINQSVVDGLRHGFFRCKISVEIVKGSRREMVIEAGKLHKFHILEEDLPR